MLLCLMLCAACSTNDRSVLVITRTVKQRLPSDLVKPCPRPLDKSAATTGVIVERLQHAEASLATCAAQVDGVRAWNEATAAGPVAARVEETTK
ncbi:MAG: Rz1-like lysis system protein LysC [Proteobacteria bacterium]|nr:Rz1-like lysis system protein LysC [Pseudomonadota bacterium]